MCKFAQYLHTRFSLSVISLLLCSASFADNPSSLVWSTFLGGWDGEEGKGIVLDGSGNAYVAGTTSSSDFPTTVGAFDKTYNGGDAFVAKLDSTGSGLVYSTYLGGSGDDRAYGIALDDSGNAYVIGNTGSLDFPTTSGAFDRTYNGDDDAFVAKINSSGTALVYSTYLGGSGDDNGLAVKVDSFGSAYAIGWTGYSDFPTTPGAYDTTYNGADVTGDTFVVKLSNSGDSLVYSTYLGGSDDDLANSLAIDHSESAYIIGQTGSANFPTTEGAFDQTYNVWDVFVTKLNASAPIWITQLI